MHLELKVLNICMKMKLKSDIKLFSLIESALYYLNIAKYSVDLLYNMHTHFVLYKTSSYNHSFKYTYQNFVNIIFKYQLLQHNEINPKKNLPKNPDLNTHDSGVP